MSDELKTFIDLYNFLQNYNENNIIKWLKKRWSGKDKQESLLRLFAGLGLISKLNNYTICEGNFNTQEGFTIMKTLKSVFYNEREVPKQLNDKGDSSDLTCISKNNDKHLLLTTSKNLKKELVGKLDIDKILTNFKQYETNGYIMSLCICIRDITMFQKMKNRSEKTNEQLKKYIDKEDTIIIDWNDLNEAYCKFKSSFNNKTIDDIKKLNQNTLCLKCTKNIV